MREKTPTPEGPPSSAVPESEELVTAPGVVVAVPVDNSPVVVDVEDAALVEALAPEVPVLETASCARDICGAAPRKNTTSKRGANRFISRVSSKRFEPRRKQEPRNRFVAGRRLHVKSLCFIASAPAVVLGPSPAAAFATG